MAWLYIILVCVLEYVHTIYWRIGTVLLNLCSLSERWQIVGTVASTFCTHKHTHESKYVWFLHCNLSYIRREKDKFLYTRNVLNRKEHFQSYVLNWLCHYQANDSAKYHFLIQLVWIEKIWYLLMLCGEHTKIILNILQAKCVIFLIGFDVITTMIMPL